MLPAAAAAGWRAIAPDLPGFGDSPADLPGTWERQIEHVERFRRALGLDQVVLGVHDWGGLIGLRWACDHPDAVSALFITDTGFFPDGRWHGMAKTLRTEGEGEQLLDNINRDLFGMALRQISPALPDDAIDEYWKAYGDEERKQGQLDLYRSGDFSKLEPYDGRLGAARRADPDRVGREGRVRARGRRAPVPQADTRLAAGGAGRRRPLRDGGRLRAGRPGE